MWSSRQHIAACPCTGETPAVGTQRNVPPALEVFPGASSCAVQHAPAQSCGCLGLSAPPCMCPDAGALLLLSWDVQRLCRPHPACAQVQESCCWRPEMYGGSAGPTLHVHRFRRLLLASWDVWRLCQPHPACAQVQEAAAGVLGCTEVWKRGNHSVKPAASLLRLIAALDELPVAQMLSKSWENSELGEQPACLAAWGICLLLRHPLGTLLLALHVTLFDRLSPGAQAAWQQGQGGWHAARSCSALKTRRTETRWGPCATAVALGGACHQGHPAAGRLVAGCRLCRAGRGRWDAGVAAVLRRWPWLWLP